MLKWKEGRLSADITEEHRKPSDAAVVIFQVSSPAVLLNVLRKFGFGLLIV
jgi:hypothetical protein